ncbi:SDR family oxidoreductase [Kiritimatiella glycovorans]|uniref:General stress protein 39 n=1 Tax=Kiritimatiella glycovorans TaxID=1307763 RepID=A0A0G3ECT3_9BACT|nr:SDR family oxidoreductase [Kiritimatiella glycovorans]AKJ64123.1 General stress protein 39 [Kiritimatiella glycovorans]
MDLTGQRALVTGGAKRIGRGIAEALAGAGAEVAVQYRHSADEAAAFCEAWRVRGVKAVALQADFSDGRAGDLLERAAGELGGLDLLINNASVFPRGGFPGLGAEQLERVFRPNAYAPLELMQGYAARFGTGSIINLLDRRVRAHDTTCVAYALTKKTLEEATALAALAFAPDVRVNAVAPGPVLAPSSGGAEPGGATPLRRRPEIADIADAVLYLAGARAVTGQTLFVDGGQHLLGNGV